jgi:hypothetical protein
MPSTHPRHCKAIHDSLTVLPKLEKIKKLAVMHSTWQITAPPSEPVPYVPRYLPRALGNIRHMCDLSTSSEGGGSKAPEIKCCKKYFKKHTYKTSITTHSLVSHVSVSRLVLCPSYVTQKVGINQM